MNWDAVGDYQWDFNYMLLGLSFLLLVGALTCMVLIWRYILSAMGHSLPFKTSWRIWFLSNLGRYLPGKVWQVMGMVYLCEREDVPKAVTFTSIVLGLSLYSLAGLFLMYLYILFGEGEQFSQYAYVFLLCIPLGICVLYPAVFEKTLNFALRLVKKEQIKLNVRFSMIITLFFIYIVIWGVYGLAFYLFASSIFPISFSHFPALVCIFAASYVIGLVAIFVPAGIGVRESLLTTLLSLFIPLPIATIIALSARLWFTAGELLGAGIGLRLQSGKPF
jgi:uncharacterized membrane protein YbhN (UPF0104 family)